MSKDCCCDKEKFECENWTCSVGRLTWEDKCGRKSYALIPSQIEESTFQSTLAALAPKVADAFAHPDTSMSALSALGLFDQYSTLLIIPLTFPPPPTSSSNAYFPPAPMPLSPRTYLGIYNIGYTLNKLLEVLAAQYGAPLSVNAYVTGQQTVNTLANVVYTVRFAYPNGVFVTLTFIAESKVPYCGTANPVVINMNVTAEVYVPAL